MTDGFLPGMTWWVGCYPWNFLDYANCFQAFTYPTPLWITSRELAAKYEEKVEGMGK
jgi:hypothetical protein